MLLPYAIAGVILASGFSQSIYKTGATKILMKKFLFVLAGGFLSAFAAPATAELSLRINGDLVAAPGDVDLFRFWPGQRKLEVRTFFKDIRCYVPETLPVEAASLRLDQINDGPVLEPEGAYSIPDSGSIVYRLAESEIQITTSGIQQTLDADCFHQFLSAVGTIDPGTGLPSKGAVRVNGFEDAFQLSALPAASGIGFDLKLRNISELFAGRFIQIPLDLTVSTSLTSAPQPSFLPSTQVMGTTWTVPLLWPGESSRLEVRYSGLNPGDSIDVAVSDPQTGENLITAQNRNPDAPTEPYFLPASLVTVVNTSTRIVVP